MRIAWLLVLLVGCVQPTVDDMPAPAPTDAFADAEPFDPPGAPRITGTIRDVRGAPLAGAVWVETVDIREPVNNLAAYRSAFANERIDVEGDFSLRLDEAAYHLVVDVPGKRLYRSPLSTDLHHEIRIGNVFPVVAHRGASFYAPENTLASLEKAALLGATSVEADVRMSADGRLVVVHDESLTRTAGISGLVHETTYEEMRNLDVGTWFDPSFSDQRIPTLQEILDAADLHGVRLLLDVKSPAELRDATWNQVLAVVGAAGAQDRITFGAFRQSGMEACTARAGMTCAWFRVEAEGVYEWIERAGALGVDWVSIPASMVTPLLIDHANSLGVLVQAMTTNDPQIWARLLAYGVDSISTDRMGYLIDHLNGVPVPYDP